MIYGTGITWKRPHDRGSASSDTTESREPNGVGHPLRNQSEASGEVEEAALRSRCVDGIQGTASTVLTREAESHSCGLSPAYAAPPGGLPVCLAADDPAAVPLRPVTLLSAPRRQSITRGGEFSTRKEGVQKLPHRLLLLQYCGSAPSGRQALPVRGNRSHQHSYVCGTA